MSQTDDEQQPDRDQDADPERREIAEMEERLDAEAEGDGLAAEAGRGEENGLAEG
ncbi:hypothetical protein GON03_04380 [Nocardioides sp. MAH-18]|uniref:Uncharacterized protein n=1 Tax=Nocardioides agri TaxID=2682843 RepID=A0A6L6XS05_9ACTN|nr:MULTISPECIES: hypothetical protein [unclassified Nocardioides]MBA2953538.1 hypothetical protein [Nocardioides sp. CGMCC 1.13656]MVQ48405.1 hypothetical protein [Nocardioides sp. MAH-18]